jgi:glycyl-tRNA synthetase beta chain
MSNDLLIELGCEEIPARFVESLLVDFSRQIQKGLTDSRISFNTDSVKTFATYRRLAVCISDVAKKQDDGEEVFNGPPLSVAKNDDGEWSPAAIGFSKKVGIELADLGSCVGKDAKARAILSVRKVLKGAPTEEVLASIIELSLASLSLPIAMRWGTHKGVFFRPVHWLVALFGGKVIPVDFFDVSSGNVSKGHRFLSKAKDGSIDGKDITIKSAASYEKQLESVSVCVDASKRKEEIVSFLKEQGQDDVDGKLLNEVVYLVEQGTPLVGQIDSKYLQLPADVLVQSMAIHQKYFPVFKEGVLSNQFIFVGDSITAKNRDTVIKGNERVLGARLEDAMFFWEEDLKAPLSTLVPKLDAVLFQKGLGSVLEKTKRIDTLAQYVAKLWAADLKSEDISRVATLCKAVLVSLMVYEFADLQGVVGSLYAEKSGESSSVSLAIKEHYYPLNSTSDLPSELLGAVVSVADKVDTIVACYQNGLIPSGSKDPLGVRRAMLGLLSLSKVFGKCDFSELFKYAYGVLGKGTENFDKLELFFEPRLKTFIEEHAGVSHDIADSVMSLAWTDLNEALSWAVKLSQLKTSDYSRYKQLVETSIRVNRLSKKGGSGVVDDSLFEQDIEAQSFAVFKQLDNITDINDFSPLLDTLTTYFDDVLVMAESESVKENRLGFLTQVDALFAGCFRAESLVIE